MRAMHHVAVVVAVVGLFACERHDREKEQVSETKTTGAPVEPAKAPVEPTPPPAASTAQAQPESAPPPCEPTKPHAEKAHPRKKAKPAVSPEPGTMMDEDKQTTEPMPSDESKAKSTTQTPTTPQPVEPRTTVPPEPAPAMAAPPPPPYENHSTTLGDGRSGMYTDGEGTYGGRSTWGTGGSQSTRTVPPSR